MVMDNISLKMPVTVKAKLTEKLRKRITDDLTRSLAEVDAQLSAIDSEERRMINERAQSDLNMLQAIRQHYGAEREKRLEFKEETEHRLADIKKLALGAELVQGQLERQVEVKVGDDMRELMNVEILVEDDKIIAIRS